MKSSTERLLSAARLLSLGIALGYLGDEDEVLERFKRPGGTIDWLLHGLHTAKLLEMKKVGTSMNYVIFLSIHYSYICLSLSLPST